MNMWSFLIEWKGEEEAVSGIGYPAVFLSVGEIPDVAPEKMFESDEETDDDDFHFDDEDDEFGEEFRDNFGYEDDPLY